MLDFQIGIGYVFDAQKVYNRSDEEAIWPLGSEYGD